MPHRMRSGMVVKVPGTIAFLPCLSRTESSRLRHWGAQTKEPAAAAAGSCRQREALERPAGALLELLSRAAGTRVVPADARPVDRGGGPIPRRLTERPR